MNMRLRGGMNSYRTVQPKHKLREPVSYTATDNSNLSRFHSYFVINSCNYGTSPKYLFQFSPTGLDRVYGIVDSFCHVGSYSHNDLKFF